MPEMNIRQRLAPANDDERLALIRKDLETAREALMRVMSNADKLAPTVTIRGETPQRLHLRTGQAVLTIDDCSQVVANLAFERERERERAEFEDRMERAS